MRRMKFTLAKMLLSVLALFILLPNAMVVYAEVVEVNLTTLEEAGDLTVMFSYEGERPEITFLSPSGKEYAEGISAETELVAAHGEGWSTYSVIGAQAGTWRVRCDKKNNEYVDYSIVEAIDGLSIQSFDIVSMEEGKANLSFLVNMGEDERVWYRYTVTAIAGEDESAGKELKSGSAYTGEICEITVDLKLSSYQEYRFLLEVTATQGLEMFDSMVSEPFAYENPDTPEAIKDIYVTVNSGDNSCVLDWEDFRLGWSKPYSVVVFADADTDNPIYTNETTSEQDAFFYPVGTEKLIVQLYYKENGILSRPFSKEIDLVNGERLEIVTPEITSGTQLELAYKANTDSLLKVQINEENGQYNIDGEGSVYFPLNEGVNTVKAEFAGSNNITYSVTADIFRDSAPPVLTLFENLDGMTFRKGEAVISGTAKNAAKVTVNDIEVTVGEDGVFEHVITLAEGSNDVMVVATSEGGIGTSRSMRIMREGGGVISGSFNNYLPLLIAFGVGVLIIVYSLIFVRRKDKAALKPKKSVTYKRIAVSVGIWALILDIVGVSGYIYFYLFNSSRRYIELMKESVSKAARYVDYEQYCFRAVLILTGVMVLNLLVGLAVRAIRKKKESSAE